MFPSFQFLTSHYQTRKLENLLRHVTFHLVQRWQHHVINCIVFSSRFCGLHRVPKGHEYTFTTDVPYVCQNTTWIFESAATYLEAVRFRSPNTSLPGGWGKQVCGPEMTKKNRSKINKKHQVPAELVANPIDYRVADWETMGFSNNKING